VAWRKIGKCWKSLPEWCDRRKGGEASFPHMPVALEVEMSLVMCEQIAK